MLDVVIVTYNRPDYLSEILEVLNIQDSPVNVIISDDGGDRVLDWRRWSCVGKYLWTKHEGYQRVARYNEALRYVRSPQVVLLDDDTVPQDRLWSSAYETQIVHNSVVRGMHVTLDNRLALPPWFSTVNVGFWTECLVNHIGGFDSRYNGNYGYEDLDLGKELEKRGVTILSGQPETAAKHLGRNMGYDVNVNLGLYRQKWGL